MAMESHGQHSLPPLLDSVATTPPPSYPLLSSDQFPFSDFDSYDWDRLEDNDAFFGSTPHYLDSLDISSSQLARRASVVSSAPSPTRRSPLLSSASLSPRPFSSRHSTRNSPIPRLATEPTTEPVDLTGQSSPEDMAPRRAAKRSAPSSQDTRADKKRKRGSHDTTSQGEPVQNGATEEVDLRDDDEVAVADILQKQREEQIKRQRKEGEERPKLSALQCIICLESPTDLTVTSCGHLFCHACLMPALNTGEPSKSRCPVCRRAVNRVKKSGKALDFQPLELKLKTKSSGGTGGKGKEKETSGSGSAAESGK